MQRVFKFFHPAVMIFSAFFFLAFSSCPRQALAQDIAKGNILVLDDKSSGTEIIKLDTDGKEITRKAGFKGAMDMDIDFGDNSIWVADTGNNQVVKVSLEDNTELARISGFSQPVHGAVCQREGSYWVADEGHYEVAKISRDGKKELLRVSGFVKPHDIETSPYDSSVWVADYTAGRIVKLDDNGKILGELSGLGSLWHLAVSPFDGSCWVIEKASGNNNLNAVLKISPDCKQVLAKKDFNKGLAELSVNPVDGSCWVISRAEGIIYNISAEGNTALFEVNIFSRIMGISDIDRQDGSFWLSVSGKEGSTGGEIIKISATGKELRRIGGLSNPQQVIETKS